MKSVYFLLTFLWISGVLTAKRSKLGGPNEILWYCREGYHYGFNSRAHNFFTGQELCESYGAYMTDVHSQAEWDFLYQTMNALWHNETYKAYHFWLGGHDLDGDSVFEWLSGEPFDFTNWNDERDVTEPYIHMQPMNDWRWNLKNDRTDMNNGVICKKKTCSPPPPPECITDDDCKVEGEICTLLQKCVEGCRLSRECRAHHCNCSGECTDDEDPCSYCHHYEFSDGECRPGCAHDSDCAGQLTCNSQHQCF